MNAENVTVVMNTPKSETEGTAPTVWNPQPGRRGPSKVPPLDPKLKEQFVAYFKQRYPCTTKILIRRWFGRYRVRVFYRGEHPRRTFWIMAATYETLVLKTEYTYSVVRGLPRATNR